MSKDQIEIATRTIKETCGTAEIGVVLGSGLGDYVEALENPTYLVYSQIPGFPVSTVEGHQGRWYTGTLYGKKVCMMQGRFHAYEGYPLNEVTLPIRVMSKLGVKTLLLTNASGGANRSFSPGDLMVITDHINLSGMNPLIGPNMDEFGPRFPDMSQVYSHELRQKLEEVGKEKGIQLQKGVYCWFSGPCYETPAEIKMAQILGGDAVGMSTVPEAIVARHCGMSILGISCITNMAAGILDASLNHEEVVKVGQQVKSVFRNLVDGMLEKL
ncbi:MAG: purine-nucleoside phosphorylase [Clostridiales bacterium]|nr:purine-nucleoside phosphorylase [Clostridiales bacterium]